MITFMEWVVLTEAWTRAFAPVLMEGKRGSPVDYHNYAKMFTTFVMDAIEKGNYPGPLKDAAAQLRDQLRDKHAETELSASVLGGKMRGRLSKISPNDQEEVIMTAAKNYWQVLPKVLGDWNKLNDDVITPEDLAGRISGSIQDYVGYAVKDHFRRFSRKSYKHHGTPLSDVGDDDGRRPEASYEDGEEASRPALGMTRGIWNNAIHIVMTAQENLTSQIKEIQKARAEKRSRQETTQLESRVEHLATALAIMRNMPSQMGKQLGMQGEEGDNLIYDRLASMVKDAESDMHPSDRALLGHWANQKGDANHKFRNLIATAIWIAAGMKPDLKPKKALKDDHWFYELALDIEDNENDPASGVTSTPVDPTPAKSPVKPVVAAPQQAEPVVAAPRKAEPTPARKSVQKSLFDDMD